MLSVLMSKSYINVNKQNMTLRVTWNTTKNREFLYSKKQLQKKPKKTEKKTPTMNKHVQLLVEL